MSDSVPTNPNPNTVPNSQLMGGRRHRRKGHKTRKEPNVLKSWRKFVRKVQHEEHLTYPKAMKRASQRKSEWQRGGGEDEYDDDDENSSNTGATGGRRRRRRSRKQRGGDDPDEDPDEQYGGRRRRTRRQRGGDGDDPDEDPDEQDGGRRRRSRKQRGGNAPAPSSAPASAPASVDGFDENWTKYGSVSVGGSRKRRRHRR